MAGMLLTNAGRNAIAAALADDTPIVVSELGLGEANRYPTGGESALVNEVLRKPVLGTANLADGTTEFLATVGAGEGPYHFYEVGLFDSAGALLFIGRCDLAKPAFEEQTMSLDIRVKVVTSCQHVSLSYSI